MSGPCRTDMGNLWWWWGPFVPDDLCDLSKTWWVRDDWRVQLDGNYTDTSCLRMTYTSGGIDAPYVDSNGGDTDNCYLADLSKLPFRWANYMILQCSCGYDYNMFGDCLDIDECKEDHECPDNSQCYNAYGS